VNSIHLCLRNEASVRDEVGCQQRHATLTRECHKACINVLVGEPLHELVVAYRVSRHVDRLSDAWGRDSCFFDARYGFHSQIVSQRYGNRNRL
jgi:hypothetical protein